MPIVALLIDVLVFFLYSYQAKTMTTTAFGIGFAGQVVLTVILLFMVSSYKGKKYARVQTTFFMRMLSIRYALIFFSFLINLILLFLYGLNYFGINNVVFRS